MKRFTPTYLQTPPTWLAQFCAEQPQGRAREYLVWLAMRWDEFVQTCIRMDAQELLKTDMRHAVFAWWMEMSASAAHREGAQ